MKIKKMGCTSNEVARKVAFQKNDSYFLEKDTCSQARVMVLFANNTCAPKASLRKSIWNVVAGTWQVFITALLFLIIEGGCYVL